jgi:predicted  nucleic acid-binding Zn-ribbon protein
MTENNAQTLPPVDASAENAASSGNGGGDLKEIKTLIWMGIISAWIILGLLLFIGSGNYRNSQAIHQLNDPERFSAVMEEIDALRKEVAETQKALGTVSGELKNQVAGIAGTVRSELEGNAKTIQASLAQITKDQNQIGGQIQAGQDALGKSIAQRLENQQGLLGKGQDQLQSSLDRLVKEQQTVLDAVKSDNIQNTERREILKRFFQNQTALLEKLSETFAGPDAGATAQ